MKYKLLGRTGVKISELCCGTMTFGSEADEAESARIFNACRNAGINFFDCANVYGEGRAETILGKLTASCRDELVIASKATQRTSKDVNGFGSSRRNIMLEVEKSLKRLQTDRIDLYFIHHFDPNTPMDETLRALDDLVRQGKILYTGVSNWAAWQTAKGLGLSAAMGLARFECVQPMYNLVKRQAEVEILPMAASEQLGVIVYNPLAAGLLSGKYSRGNAPDSGRLLEKKMYAVRYSDPAYAQVAGRFVDYAKKTGVHPVTLAIKWVQANPAVTAPIIGARTVAQVEASLAAVDFELSCEMLAEVSALSAPPPIATDRLEEVLEPQYRTTNR